MVVVVATVVVVVVVVEVVVVQSVDGCWSPGLVTSSIMFGFSQSTISVKRCFLYNHTIKVCASYLSGCPETSAPSALNLTVSLFLRSSGSNPRGEVEVNIGGAAPAPTEQCLNLAVIVKCLA